MRFIPLTIDEMIQNSLYMERYSAEEIELVRKLEKLFTDWHMAFTSAQDETGFIIRDYKADHMSFDGFYPGYLKQKNKMLFIGREGRGISGTNYLECLFQAIKENWIDNKSLNQHVFHRRMIYLSYALEKSEEDYPTIPYASKISPFFGTEISYAFMNLSKFSNENASFNADYDLINKAVEISTTGRNFIKQEISILNPDIIFTMNMKDYFSHLGEITPIDPEMHNDSWVKPHEVCFNGKKALLIDTCHFSYVLNEKKDFFDPAIRAIKMYNKRFGLPCFQ